jgi:hypothetical protein
LGWRPQWAATLGQRAPAIDVILALNAGWGNTQRAKLRACHELFAFFSRRRAHAHERFLSITRVIVIDMSPVITIAAVCH